MNVSFFVPGIPAPGGSKKGFAFRRKNGTTGVAITEDCKRSSPWRAVVQHAIAQAVTGPPLEGPVVLDVTFVLPRPKGHTGKRGLKPSAPAFPTTKPDATKLLRPLEDACKGMLWRDDSQIVDQNVRKRYADAYNPVGARVIVMAAESPRHVVPDARDSRQDRIYDVFPGGLVSGIGANDLRRP